MRSNPANRSSLMPWIVPAAALFGCTPPAATPTPTVSAPEAAPIDDVPTPHVVEIRLESALTWPGIHQPDELNGLFTALVESGLADLADVAPMVGHLDPSPGLSGRLLDQSELWTGRLGLSADAGVIHYGLLLCDPDELCTDLEADGTREDPAAAVAVLLQGAADALGRPPLADAETTWAMPQSADAYALLVCGRGAATFYGIRPPVSPENRGDDRRDPMARAVFIDPAMPVGWWIVGRDRALFEEWGPAREAFTRAAIARPTSVLMQADEAAALAEGGKWEAAWQAWEQVQEKAPDDLRFAVPRARAALAAGKIPESLAILDALPPAFQGERNVAEMRVAIAEATGASSNYDDLLARWQSAAPHEPEPVRRRITLRIRDGRYQEALDLARELEARGEAAEASRLTIALSVGLGQLDVAATRADGLGWADQAARLRARAALEADPAAADVTDGLVDPVALVVGGEAALAAGNPQQALDRATLALADDPWLPEGLDVEARALDALGRHGEADAARARLRASEPDYGSAQAPADR
jgi:tetratricopeptide (TPR) repeat protein